MKMATGSVFVWNILEMVYVWNILEMVFVWNNNLMRKLVEMLNLPEICNTKINIRKKLICFFGRQQGRLKSAKF